MKRKGEFIFFFFAIFILFTQNVQAEEQRWIVSYRVTDLESKQIILEIDYETNKFLQNAPVFAGAGYNITITLNVGLSASYADLFLSMNLIHADSIDRFWEIHSREMNITGNYNPNNKFFTFKQVKGKYVVSAFGKIPENITLTNLDEGIVLHKPANHSTIELRGPDRTLLDEIKLNIIDSEIDSYQFHLNERINDLEDYRKNNVEPTFIELYEDFISLAIEKAEAGFVETARSMLEKLEVDVPPLKSDQSFEEKYFLPILGGLGLITVVFLFLFIRARGKLSYKSSLLEDQIMELEGLSMKASRTDKNLSARLQEINDRLKELEEI